MKKMVLTGLGSEQRFDRVPSGNADTFSSQGGTLFYLVFNDGELRVPVSEEAAHVVVQFMYGGEAQEGAESPEEASPSNGQSHTPDISSGSGTDEDGVDQV